MSSDVEARVQDAKDKLTDARRYRRGWTAATAGSAAVNYASVEVAKHVGHHDFSKMPLFPWGIGMMLGATVTLNFAIQILDATDLVRSRRSQLHWAEHDARNPLPEAEFLDQPSLEE